MVYLFVFSNFHPFLVSKGFTKNVYFFSNKKKKIFSKTTKGGNSHIIQGSCITVLERSLISQSGCFKQSMHLNLFHVKTTRKSCLAPEGKWVRLLKRRGSQSEPEL